MLTPTRARSLVYNWHYIGASGGGKSQKTRLVAFELGAILNQPVTGDSVDSRG